MNLGFMRRHRKWFFGFLWLVILAFIFLYTPALQDTGQGTPGETLGRVGEIRITVGEFQKSYLEQRRFYESLYRGRMDATTLKSLGLEEQVFQSLVTERLILLEAERLGLRVDDASVAESLRSAPEFQRDGQFLGAAEIRRRLQLQGMSVADFESSLRSQLLRQRLEALVTDGVLVSETETEQEFRRRHERVRAEYVRVDSARFADQVSVDDAEAASHFQANTEAYRIPEQRVLSYALMDQTALEAQVTLTDQDIERYYLDNRDDYSREEQVCAHHILIKVASGEEGAEGHPNDDAVKIAEDVLAQAQGGADFSTLAREFSEDLGTAAQGGDLGCFPKGRMVPEFENVAFSMDPEEISELVRSPFGYHVIRLDSIQEESYAPLDEVRERVRRELMNDRVGQLIETKATAVAAALAAGRPLAEAVSDQGLSVEKSEPFSRGAPPAPLSAPLVASRAFEMKVGEAETQPFGVPTGLAFIELAEVRESRLPELAEVQERAKQDLLDQKTGELALELAQRVRQAAESQGLERAATSNGLVRKETSDMVGRGQAYGDLGRGAELDRLAFSLEEQTLSEPLRLDAGYVILRVLEKQPFDPVAFEEQKQSIAESLRRERQSQLFQAYLSQARDRFPVTRDSEVFRRLVG